MSQMPRFSADELRARHSDIFNRPASSRLAIPAMLLLAFGILAFGLVDLDFSLTRLVTGLGQLGWITLMMLPPDPGASLPLYLKALGETLSIALLGTTLAALLALPVSLLAARNIVRSNIVRFPVRRFLDSIRGIDTLIWALVWINVVGLGPFAGVLAIAVSDFGALGKLFSEAIEAADESRSRASAPPAAARSMKSASGCCRRCCPSLAVRCSISSSRTRARRPLSASSAPAASACNSPNRSVCWSGRRCRS